MFVFSPLTVEKFRSPNGNILMFFKKLTYAWYKNPNTGDKEEKAIVPLSRASRSVIQWLSFQPFTYAFANKHMEYEHTFLWKIVYNMPRLCTYTLFHNFNLPLAIDYVLFSCQWIQIHRIFQNCGQVVYWHMWHYFNQYLQFSLWTKFLLYVLVPTYFHLFVFICLWNKCLKIKPKGPGVYTFSMSIHIPEFFFRLPQ